MISLLLYCISNPFFSLVLRGPELCAAWAPAGPYRPLYQSMVCAIPLPAGHEKQLLVDTGLIHLLVVSGLHMMFIDRWLEWLPQRPRLTLLFGYVILTGFHPPISRAFLRRLLKPYLNGRLKLTLLQAEAAGVGIALLIYPPWIFSRSFLMSWMGGLAGTQPHTSNWERALKAYLLLLPFCWASPLSLGWNVLFAPFAGGVLLPACWLAFLWHGFTLISDPIWRALLWLLDFGPQGSPLPLYFTSLQLLWLPPVIHALWLTLEVRWRRRSAFS
jgi:predicted membrane metal-binding protein